MKDIISTVKSNVCIAENVYMITLEFSEDTGVIRGGQFANISTGDGSRLLRRPLGITMAKGREISLCYQLKGSGTRALAEIKHGEKLSVLLPLGNGFNLGTAKNIAVIGGGVGIFPLVCTIRENLNKNFYSFIGFRNKSAVCLLNELEKSKSLTVVTDDGSFGGKGNAVQAFFSDKNCENYDLIISCGPPVMLKALKEQLIKSGVQTPCLVSLEERMGCGIGACLVCSCGLENGENARVCRDGPVFNIREVKL